MGTMNISLPDPMKSWVEDQAKSGRYANSSDYVRDLIRRDQEDEEVWRTLKAAVDEGFESPETDATTDTIFAEVLSRRGA